MIGLGIAFAVLIVYLIIRSNRKDVKIEPPVCPKPVTPTPLAHPYQNLIDRISGLMIKEIEKCLSKGTFEADITDWKESYQKQMKREVLDVIRNHFKQYENDFDIKFSESRFILKAKIVLKEKK